MGKTIRVGTITKEQLLVIERANRRKEEIANRFGGYVAVHKVHKSKKAYTRKAKHKGREF